MNRRLLAAILIIIMGISMIGGCSKKAEEESAQAGEYYENQKDSAGEEELWQEDDNFPEPEEGGSENVDNESEDSSVSDGGSVGGDDGVENPDQSVSNSPSDSNDADSGEDTDQDALNAPSNQGNADGGEQSEPGYAGSAPDSENSSVDQENLGENNIPEAEKPSTDAEENVSTDGEENPSADKEELPSVDQEDREEEDPVSDADMVELDYGWIDQDYEDSYKDTPISKTQAKTKDGVSYYKENSIKVVSYNIRCANDPDGNSVDEREWRLDEIFQKYDADIMGFQEVTENWEGRLHMMLSDEYDYIMVYRSEDGGKEANPIFYKPSKFKLMDAGYFWLSETPEEMGKGWDADHYRICTWAKLKVRKTGAEFIYFNTHVDYKSGPQVPSAELLIEKMKSIGGGLGGIVTGDFNLTHSAPAYTTMCGYFADSNMATVKDTSQGTFPNYGKNENGGSIIDYCFFTPKKMKAISYKVMTDLVDGKYASDHFGVCSEIIILN